MASQLSTIRGPTSIRERQRLSLKTGKLGPWREGSDRSVSPGHWAGDSFSECHFPNGALNVTAVGVCVGAVLGSRLTSECCGLGAEEQGAHFLIFLSLSSFVSSDFSSFPQFLFFLPESLLLFRISHVLCLLFPAP